MEQVCTGEVRVTWDPSREQTDTTKNITFMQLRWWMVIMPIFVLRHETAVLVKQKFVVLVRTMKRKTSFGGTLEIHAAFWPQKESVFFGLQGTHV